MTFSSGNHGIHVAFGFAFGQTPLSDLAVYILCPAPTLANVPGQRSTDFEVCFFQISCSCFNWSLRMSAWMYKYVLPLQNNYRFGPLKLNPLLVKTKTTNIA